VSALESKLGMEERLRAVARFVGAFLAVLAAVAALGTGSSAATDDFYAGKQIRLIVSSAPGGVYDVFGRLVARFFPAHLLGHPTVVVQNMPGAGGLKAANYLFNGAPRDGSVIAGVHNGIPTAPIEEPAQAHFDVNRLSWIGSISEDPFVGYVWHTSPIRNFADAKTTPSVMGSASINSMGAKMAIVSNAMFGTRFRLVTGYEDASQVKLALERGEVEGTFANSWGDLKTQQPDWIRDGKVRIIIQHGYRPQPDLADVPLIIDQAGNSADRQALDLLLERQKFARPYLAPPAVPTQRLALLRRAFDATVRDPAFVQAAQAAHLAVESPMTGEELAAAIARLASTPAAVTERLAKLFAASPAGK
jgi:tripartite-type tricarboxylate transporter receptor subunit TctC